MGVGTVVFVPLAQLLVTHYDWRFAYRALGTGELQTLGESLKWIPQIGAHWHLAADGIHLPLVIKLPGGYAGGTRVATVVQTVDVMPTILGVLGATPPKNEETTNAASLALRVSTPIALAAISSSRTATMPRPKRE